MRRRFIVSSPFRTGKAKYIFCFMLLIILTLSASISAADAVPAEKNETVPAGTSFSYPDEADRMLKITTEALTVNVGKQIKLVPEITRLTEEAPKKSTIEWTSGDENTATVSPNGDVKGINPGTVRITCRLKDNPDVTASAEVTVKQPVKSIKPETNKMVLLFGASESAAQGKLAVTVEPENATVRECTFSSSNEKVVTVDQEGNLQAVGPGNAKITITTAEEGSKVKAFCNITVGQAVSRISIPASQTLNKTQTFPIKASILPENATQKKLEYTSSDPSVVTVSSNGTVKAVECGTATITARATDGSDVSAECSIKVIQMVKSIKLGKKDLTIPFNTTYDLKPTVLPEDATKPDLRWSSSNSSIVTVNNGKLKAAGVGSATITCASTDGSNVKTTVKVRVTYTSKSKNKLSDGYPIGGPFEMKYTVENELKSGKVTVHYLTVQKLNNNYLRFTFSYNAPAGYGISAFSPPNGQFYMVLPKRPTTAGEDIIQFEVHEDDFLASSYFTMKFYGRNDQFWVFPTITYELKQYLKNPSSIPLSDSTSKPVTGQSSSGNTSILENSTVKNLISSCPSIGKSTKSTKEFYASVSEYNRDYPSGKHTWRISIQNGVTYFADENQMTALVYKPKGTLSEVADSLSWQIKILDALPSIQSSAQKNGISLYAEKRAPDGDYAKYADYNGIIDLMNNSKRTNVRDRMQVNLDDARAFATIGDLLSELDTNGNGEIDPEEIFDFH